MISLIVPPGNGGVHDFSSRLVRDLAWKLEGRAYIFETDQGNWGARKDSAVILQFSGYGFDKRGAPLWLLREIEKRRKSIRTFGVFFHELYAFGPPWSSSFWLSPLQRHIARRLVELSDFWMTNREGSAEWLRRFAGNKPHAVLPVFSNVGELASPAGERGPRIIVFGSAGLREKTYHAAGVKLFAWAKRASLEIHDIGPPITEAVLSATLRTGGVIQHGQLDENEVDRLMTDARYGLVAYPVAYAAKSGVFAAYAAHGICPLLLSEHYGQADGLVPGIHYQPGVPNTENCLKAASIGAAALDWYQTHGIDRHSDVIKQFVTQLGSK